MRFAAILFMTLSGLLLTLAASADTATCSEAAGLSLTMTNRLTEIVGKHRIGYGVFELANHGAQLVTVLGVRRNGRFYADFPSAHLQTSVSKGPWTNQMLPGAHVTPPDKLFVKPGDRSELLAVTTLESTNPLAKNHGAQLRVVVNLLPPLSCGLPSDPFDSY